MTQNFGSPLLFPVVWLDEGLELNEEMTGMIKRDLTRVLMILDIIQWTLGRFYNFCQCFNLALIIYILFFLVGVGAALVIGMLGYYYIVRKKMSKTSSTEVITAR
jgi:hypothetical protein